MERLGRLVVGEDASLIMGSVEDAFQFCLAAPFVAGDKFARDVGRQTILEEFQCEADAFSVGGCHVLLVCGCYWNSVRSQFANAVEFGVLVSRSLALIAKPIGRWFCLVASQAWTLARWVLPGANLRSACGMPSI